MHGAAGSTSTPHGHRTLTAHWANRALIQSTLARSILQSQTRPVKLSQGRTFGKNASGVSAMKATHGGRDVERLPVLQVETRLAKRNGIDHGETRSRRWMESATGAECASMLFQLSGRRVGWRDAVALKLARSRQREDWSEEQRNNHWSDKTRRSRHRHLTCPSGEQLWSRPHGLAVCLCPSLLLRYTIARWDLLTRP